MFQGLKDSGTFFSRGELKTSFRRIPDQLLRVPYDFLFRTVCKEGNWSARRVRMPPGFAPAGDVKGVLLSADKKPAAFMPERIWNL